MHNPPYHVLIAEDEEIARRSLRMICERSDCPIQVVAEVATGPQVLQVLGKVQPDIILLDVVMPGIDGLAVARIVNERYPATRVIIISAHESFDYAQQALRARVIDYLLKPVRPQQLVSLLQKLCAALDTERSQTSSSHIPASFTPGRSDQATSPAPPPHARMLKHAQEYIAAHYAEALTLEQVAAHVALSPTYFSRVFKQEMGCTFVDYLIQMRLEAAKHLLRTTTLSLAEISYAVGYQSPNYLSELFKNTVGITASAYRRGNT